MLYKDVFRELNRRGVEYLVVGGVAVVFHGVIRLTIDLDLMVDLREENLEKFVAGMTSLGYKPHLPVNAKALLDAGERKKWGKEKNMIVFPFYNTKKVHETVDVFIDDPVGFKKAYAERNSFNVEGVKVPVISLEYLEKMKKISGRKQDLADIEALKYLKEVSDEKRKKSNTPA